MVALNLLFKAAGGSSPQHPSVFGARPPAETVVKEVVQFKPAPDPYKEIRRASKRVEAGRSVFADTVLGEAQDVASE